MLVEQAWESMTPSPNEPLLHVHVVGRISETRCNINSVELNGTVCPIPHSYLTSIKTNMLGTSAFVYY